MGGTFLDLNICDINLRISCSLLKGFHCHCEHIHCVQCKLREAISHSVIPSEARNLVFRLLRPLRLRSGSSQWHFRVVIAVTKETIFSMLIPRGLPQGASFKVVWYLYNSLCLKLCQKNWPFYWPSLYSKKSQYGLVTFIYLWYYNKLLSRIGK